MTEELDGLVENEDADDIGDADSDDSENVDVEDADETEEDVEGDGDVDFDDDEGEEADDSDEDDVESLRREAQSWKDRFYAASETKKDAPANDMTESDRRKALIEYAANDPYLGKKLHRIYNKYFDPDDPSEYQAELDIFIGEVDVHAKNEYDRFVQHTEKLASKSKGMLSEYGIKQGTNEYKAVKKDLLKAGIDLDNPATMANHDKKLLDFAIETTAQKIKSMPKVNVKSIGKKRNVERRPKSAVIDAAGGSAIPKKPVKFDSLSDVTRAIKAGLI